MRAILRALLAITTILLTAVVLGSPAHAEGSGSCNVIKDPTCTVNVDGDGDGQSNDGGGGNNIDPADPCAAYPDAAYGDTPPKVSQACADNLQYHYCRALVGDAADGLERPPVQWTVEETAAINEGLAEEGCPPVTTPASLAEQAWKTIAFPHPSGERSPGLSRLYDGYPFTYVHLPTFYWTNPDTWITLTATASADGFTANVTARPVQLIFDPGDGGQPAVCDGPGRPWTASDGNGPATDGACAYTYVHATSGVITSTQTIVWRITWTGTGGTSGEIPSLSTSTAGPLQVLQVQVVNR